ncbi:hypothetical protein AVEN_141035-1 [Araneus ventricosus]|uniref:Uncharacterized protein n=1 Tax=Araneus ventricosus TaxID=182803 RepID=A0A4Y2UG47_ARAVE|nr:hypothetical protein AVEN_141035-1 [Araneus ventricosus]
MSGPSTDPCKTWYVPLSAMGSFNSLSLIIIPPKKSRTSVLRLTRSSSRTGVVVPPVGVMVIQICAGDVAKTTPHQLGVQRHQS